MARNTHMVKKAQKQLGDVYKGVFIPAGTTLLEIVWLVHLFQLRQDGS